MIFIIQKVLRTVLANITLVLHLSVETSYKASAQIALQSNAAFCCLSRQIAQQCPLLFLFCFPSWRSSSQIEWLALPLLPFACIPTCKPLLWATASRLVPGAGRGPSFGRGWGCWGPASWGWRGTGGRGLRECRWRGERRSPQPDDVSLKNNLPIGNWSLIKNLNFCLGLRPATSASSRAARKQPQRRT